MKRIKNNTRSPTENDIVWNFSAYTFLNAMWDYGHRILTMLAMKPEKEQAIEEVATNIFQGVKVFPPEAYEILASSVWKGNCIKGN